MELLGLDFYLAPLSRFLPGPVARRPFVPGRDMVGGWGRGGGCGGAGGLGGASNARRVSRGCTRGIHRCPEGCTRGIDGIWTSNSHLSVSDRCEIKSRFENLAENPTTPSPEGGGSGAFFFLVRPQGRALRARGAWRGRRIRVCLEYEASLRRRHWTEEGKPP